MSLDLQFKRQNKKLRSQFCDLSFLAPTFLYIQITFTIRTFAGITGCRLKRRTTIRTSHSHQLYLIRTYRFIIHQFLCPRQYLCPDRFRIKPEFPMIFININRHTNRIQIGAFCKACGQNRFSFDMHVVKVMNFNILRKFTVFQKEVLST